MKKSTVFRVAGLIIAAICLTSNLSLVNAQDQNKPKQVLPKKNEMRQNVKGGAPELVSPADKAVLTNFPRETKFEWKPLAGAKSYELEVEINDGQWKMIKNEKCAGVRATVNFPGDNPGRWRVRAVFDEGSFSPWKSSEFSYKTGGQEKPKPKAEKGTTKQGEEALKAPEPLSPEAGATFSNMPREIKFTWTALPGLKKYEVQVECKEGNAWKIVKKEIVETTAFSFKFVGAQPGRWRVCGIEEGKKSTFSPWREFTYTR